MVCVAVVLGEGVNGFEPVHAVETEEGRSSGSIRRSTRGGATWWEGRRRPVMGWFARLVRDMGWHGRFEVGRPSDTVRWMDGAEPRWDPWVVASALQGMAIWQSSGSYGRSRGGSNSVLKNRSPGRSALRWRVHWARRAGRTSGWPWWCCVDGPDDVEVRFRWGRVSCRTGRYWRMVGLVRQVVLVFSSTLFSGVVGVEPGWVDGMWG